MKHTPSLRLSFAEGVTAVLICAAVGLLTLDWLSVVSTFVLMAGLRLVWTHDGLFVLPAAFTFHWVETSIGLFYKSLFGRSVPTIYSSHYEPMVLIALGCCLAIAIGTRLGLSAAPQPREGEERPYYAFSFSFLIVAYVIATAFEGTLASLAFEYPSIRQIIVTADTARLGILFLLLRRLLVAPPRWGAVAVVLGVEVALGITGFFAGFREPLVLAALALMEIFDRRSARHWAAMSVGAAGAIAFGILWMGIRGEYRKNFVQIDNFETSRSARLTNIQSLSMDFLRADSSAIWQTTDLFVDRMWAVYYPALAIDRVPTHVPHTDGAILTNALVHIVTPRVLFPDKPDLESDSEKVRRYSGVMVAGAEQNTSIAFGYAAEAYVDFGLPWMFLPVFGFGLAMGWFYGVFRKLIRHHELFVAYGTVTFWISMYLFERSWATMLGVALGMFVYLGVPTLLLDWLLLMHQASPGAGRLVENTPHLPTA